MQSDKLKNACTLCTYVHYSVVFLGCGPSWLYTLIWAGGPCLFRHTALSSSCPHCCLNRSSAQLFPGSGLMRWCVRAWLLNTYSIYIVCCSQLCTMHTEFTRWGNCPMHNMYMQMLLCIHIHYMIVFYMHCYMGHRLGKNPTWEWDICIKMWRYIIHSDVCNTSRSSLGSGCII